MIVFDWFCWARVESGLKISLMGERYFLKKWGRKVAWPRFWGRRLVVTGPFLFLSDWLISKHKWKFLDKFTVILYQKHFRTVEKYWIEKLVRKKREFLLVCFVEKINWNWYEYIVYRSTKKNGPKYKNNVVFLESWVWLPNFGE